MSREAYINGLHRENKEYNALIAPPSNGTLRLESPAATDARVASLQQYVHNILVQIERISGGDAAPVG